MPSNKRFPPTVLSSLAKAKILGVRAGSEHKYTGIWVVVVENRVFVRSWNDKPSGWYRAFLEQPVGSIQVDGKEVAVRGRPTRSERLRRAVTAAYGQKYSTRASVKWVTGFAEPSRLEATLELVPI